MRHDSSSREHCESVESVESIKVTATLRATLTRHRLAPRRQLLSRHGRVESLHRLGRSTPRSRARPCLPAPWVPRARLCATDRGGRARRTRPFRFVIRDQRGGGKVSRLVRDQGEGEGEGEGEGQGRGARGEGDNDDAPVSRPRSRRHHSQLHRQRQRARHCHSPSCGQPAPEGPWRSRCSRAATSACWRQNAKGRTACRP